MSRQIIIGLDEAGRGPLAGPIVAAAVLSCGRKKEQPILGLVRDSKELTPLARAELFLEIIKNFFWAVRLLDNNFIDRYGIQAANRLVIAEALEELRPYSGTRKITIVSDYVGGFVYPGISFYKKGESKFPEIAAASIVAKVYRDTLMAELARHYPQHDFQIHKGYGTAEHFAKIKKHGLTPVHRKSFVRGFYL